MRPHYKNGIVKEVDGKRGLARVEFPDSDGVASWWLAVNSSFTGGSKVYAMPEKGSQVCCLTDERNEEGIILGAIYSAKDKPPAENPDEIVSILAGGREERYSKTSGETLIKQKAQLTLEIGEAKAVMKPASISLSVDGVSLIIRADGIEIKGGKITHDGRDIGKTHKHGGVEKGGAETDEPK